MTFGAKLRRMRVKRGWSLRELGRKTKLNYLVIFELERAQNPRLDHIGTIAAAFGVSPLDLLKGVRFPRRPERKVRSSARTAS